jgi:hypothetical protein
MTRFSSVVVLLLTTPVWADPPWLAKPDEEALILSMVQQFPPPVVANANHEFAAAHWFYVRERWVFNQDRPWWPLYVEETWRRVGLYSYLNRARSHDQLTEDRWRFIGLLADELGPLDFARGRMPAPAPFLDDVWK